MRDRQGGRREVVANSFWCSNRYMRSDFSKDGGEKGGRRENVERVPVD